MRETYDTAMQSTATSITPAPLHAEPRRRVRHRRLAVEGADLAGGERLGVELREAGGGFGRGREVPDHVQVAVARRWSERCGAFGAEALTPRLSARS